MLIAARDLQIRTLRQKLYLMISAPYSEEPLADLVQPDSKM